MTFRPLGPRLADLFRHVSGVTVTRVTSRPEVHLSPNVQRRILHRTLASSEVIKKMPRTTRSSKSDTPSLTVPKPPLDTPALEDPEICYSYEIARGEMGVLSFEPYKSLILPYWAFRTVPIAQNSAEVLWEIFRSYVERGDLVGADMTRKFIQMGMTRAKRYANHKGGRYVSFFNSE